MSLCDSTVRFRELKSGLLREKFVVAVPFFFSFSVEILNQYLPILRQMKFNSKTRYGIRTMLEIAGCTPGEGILQKDISIHQGISVKYLDHIIHALKVAGLIINARGKKSGYQLARPAGEISMYDIHNAFEPGICIVECLSQTCVVCEGHSGCSSKIFWTKLNMNIISFMREVSLQSLLDKGIAIAADDLVGFPELIKKSGISPA